eukprot:Skav209638  [mRNA]  locus=scaffold2751:128708:132670:- [translate_table: standard]
MRKELRFWHLTILHPGGQTVFQLRHPFRASSTGCLVGGHEHLLQLVLLVDGPQGHGAHRGGAVGVGNQRLSHAAITVDLRDHQGLVLVIAPGGGIVNDLRVLRSASNLCCPFQGEVA